jgi:hypothetical protein
MSEEMYFTLSRLEIGPRAVREAIAWYKAQPHHTELSEPERDKHIWISVVEVAGGADRSWKYIANA